jgi:hypothetical protein
MVDLAALGVASAPLTGSAGTTLYASPGPTDSRLDVADSFADFFDWLTEREAAGRSSDAGPGSDVPTLPPHFVADRFAPCASLPQPEPIASRSLGASIERALDRDAGSGMRLALSEVGGLALSEVEGLALSEVERDPGRGKRPALSEVEGDAGSRGETLAHAIWALDGYANAMSTPNAASAHAWTFGGIERNAERLEGLTTEHEGDASVEGQQAVQPSVVPNETAAAPALALASFVPPQADRTARDGEVESAFRSEISQVASDRQTSHRIPILPDRALTPMVTSPTPNDRSSRRLPPGDTEPCSPVEGRASIDQSAAVDTPGELIFRRLTAPVREGLRVRGLVEPGGRDDAAGLDAPLLVGFRSVGLVGPASPVSSMVPPIVESDERFVAPAAVRRLAAVAAALEGAVNDLSTPWSGDTSPSHSHSTNDLTAALRADRLPTPLQAQVTRDEGERDALHLPRPQTATSKETGLLLTPTSTLAAWSGTSSVPPDGTSRPAVHDVSTDLDSSLATQMIQTTRLLWHDGRGTARVTLEPEHLGAVTVALHVVEGAVSATVHASEPQVRAWLQSHEATLRQGLAEHGLALDRLVVTDERSSHDEARSARGHRYPQPHRRPAPAVDRSRFEVVV